VVPPSRPAPLGLQVSATTSDRSVHRRLLLRRAAVGHRARRRAARVESKRGRSPEPDPRRAGLPRPALLEQWGSGKYLRCPSAHRRSSGCPSPYPLPSGARERSGCPSPYPLPSGARERS